MSVAQLVASLKEQIGAELSVGDWLAIDQQRIDQFAAVTGDRQWIHIDPQRAASESPYGTTVAHGFLTVSLLPWLTGSNEPAYFQEHYPGMRYRVNYGLNRVRFPAPVKVQSRIRARTQLLSAELVDEAIEIVYRMTVDIEGESKPACVAEQVFRVFP